MTATLRFRVLVGIFAAALALSPASPAEERFEPPGATWHGNAPVPAGDSVADFEPLFIEEGYHVFTHSGLVYAFGQAGWHGNIPTPLAAGEHVIKGVPTFTGEGYTIVTNRGHVYNFGDADCPTFDSSNLVPGDEIARMLTLFTVGDFESAEEPGGPPIEFSCGLYLVSRMGNVYALDVPWCGSVTSIAGDVVDFMVDFGAFENPDGCGYTIVTDTGAVYAFGGAGWFGALDATMLGTQQVVQMEPEFGEKGVDGHVLWTDHGNSYAFGAAEWPGSLPSVAPGEDVLFTRFLAEGQHLVFTNLGRVEGLGGADSDGSLTAEQLGTQRIVDGEVAFTGGYHLVSDVGNVYAFDDGEGGFTDFSAGQASAQRVGPYVVVD